MTRYIRLHADATLDIDEHFGYLTQRDAEQALRFFDAARQTFAALARMPGMGQAYDSGDADVVNIRKWAVKGFKKYLIFYRYDDEAIEILRVIHAMRDFEPLLKGL
jgi:toxin ParE1/3/4